MQGDAAGGPQVTEDRPYGEGKRREKQQADIAFPCAMN